MILYYLPTRSSFIVVFKENPNIFPNVFVSISLIIRHIIDVRTNLILCDPKITQHLGEYFLDA
jgi:hypothetical protein